jgi:hypothetical protein
LTTISVAVLSEGKRPIISTMRDRLIITYLHYAIQIPVHRAFFDKGNHLKWWFERILQVVMEQSELA